MLRRPCSHAHFIIAKRLCTFKIFHFKKESEKLEIIFKQHPQFNMANTTYDRPSAHSFKQDAEADAAGSGYGHNKPEYADASIFLSSSNAVLFSSS
jgi:hypothetical protein